VTRHLRDELEQRTDWDVLILHYLGLDHIGHLAGPRSALVLPKLREMDGIVKLIYETVQQQVRRCKLGCNTHKTVKMFALPSVEFL